MRIFCMIAVLVLGIGALAGPARLPALAGGSAPAPDPTLTRLSGLSGRAFDVAFLQALLPGDDEGVEIAMTATLYADHPEVLRWNQEYLERTRRQIREMLAWLQEMGATPTERREGVATASVKKLRGLRGAALERVYLPLMASHLEHDVALARLAAKKANRPAMHAFAEELVKAGTQESALLRSWLKKWY